jgi:uncharacterized protein (TIGR02145 family)
VVVDEFRDPMSGIAILLVRAGERVGNEGALGVTDSVGGFDFQLSATRAENRIKPKVGTMWFHKGDLHAVLPPGIWSLESIDAMGRKHPLGQAQSQDGVLSISCPVLALPLVLEARSAGVRVLLRMEGGAVARGTMAARKTAVGDTLMAIRPGYRVAKWVMTGRDTSALSLVLSARWRSVEGTLNIRRDGVNLEPPSGANRLRGPLRSSVRVGSDGTWSGEALDYFCNYPLGTNLVPGLDGWKTTGPEIGTGLAVRRVVGVCQDTVLTRIEVEAWYQPNELAEPWVGWRHRVMYGTDASIAGIWGYRTGVFGDLPFWTDTLRLGGDSLVVPVARIAPNRWRTTGDKCDLYKTGTCRLGRPVDTLEIDSASIGIPLLRVWNGNAASNHVFENDWFAAFGHESQYTRMARDSGFSGITFGEILDSRDGQSYRTIKIGTQTWLAGNLNIKLSGVDSGWCYNNAPDNCAKYGRLYTWNAAIAGNASSVAVASGIRGVCPVGWHLPSDAEWGILIHAVGDSEMAGKKLKAIIGWDGYNGTDEFGFGVLPGGWGNSDVGFDGKGTSAVFLSSSGYVSEETTDPMAWARSFIKDRVDRWPVSAAGGGSVRCLQDP